MTTKRKQILKALAVAGSQIVDDLVDSTGLQRKNLQDNLKATLEAGLIERIRDDVTGLPAYRLTAKGRAWLESDKDDSITKSSSVTTPAGGGDISPAVKDGATSLAVATPGQALTVVEPPKPDESPAAVGSDEMTADWLRAQLTAANEEIGRLRLLQKAYRSLEPVAPPKLRYVIAEEYLLADSAEEANGIALEIAKNIEIDTPVIVFTAHAARELGDHLRVIEVFFLRHMAHGEVFADQELHQTRIFASDLVGAAKPAHLHAALDRVVFATPLGNVMEQGRHIEQPRLVPAAGQLRTKRVFMGVLRNEKPPYVAQHHEDVLVDRVHMEQVMLHLPHDAPKGPQIAPQHRGLVHQAHGMGDAQG